MTLNDLAYKLWNTVEPRLTDDENIDIRDLKDWIVEQRALFLRNEFNKRRSIDQSLVQSLGCVELQQASTSECAGFTGCTMLRTVNQIPVAIQMHNRSAITRIGPVDFNAKAFPIVESFMELNTVGNSRWNHKQIYAFLQDDYVYLKLLGNVPWQNALQYINIRGVFEDPREAGNFNEADGTPCYNDATTDFPSNRWFESYIEGAIMQYKLSLSLGASVDPLNDGADIQTLAGGQKLKAKQPNVN